MNTKLLILLSLALALDADAGSATWRLNPVSSDWNTASNWSPRTVPNGPSDTATFTVSNQPAVILSADTDADTVIFNAGASSYSTMVPAGLILTIENGITNNSDIPQSFLIDGGTLAFNGGNAGLKTNFLLRGAGSKILFNSFSSAQTGTYTIEGAGEIIFSFFARAGFGNTFTLNGNDDTVPGLLEFTDNANSSDAVINLNGNGPGANCVFHGSSHAFGTINVHGADSAAHGPGVLTFAENGGGTPFIIATAGSNGGAGGKVIYRDAAPVFSSVEIDGNASLDISGATSTSSVAFLWLKGDGLVFLGARQLAYSGDLKATFSGVIQDGGVSGGSGGSLILNGLGPLTLNGANTYSGGSTIDHRGIQFTKLNVANTAGSGTGSGPVTVNQGILSGSGTIAGAVTVAGVTQTQSGILAPAIGGKAATLTIKNLLTIGANGIYNPLIQSKADKTRIDRVNARGVTIESGARFALLADQLQSQLPVGTSFILINNTAATAVNGTFANLADGAILIVNGNNLQANYEGGDGNDLTLTVVP